MDNRTKNRGVVRLTGRTEVDAGLLKYRELLSKTDHSPASRKRLSLRLLFHPSLTARRKSKAARVVTAVVAALVVLGAVVAFAGVGLEFTPGFSGGSSVSPLCAHESFAEASGSAEFLVFGAGSPTLEARYAEYVYPGPYDGSCDDGPARLTR